MKCIYTRQTQVSPVIENKSPCVEPNLSCLSLLPSPSKHHHIHSFIFFLKTEEKKTLPSAEKAFSSPLPHFTREKKENTIPRPFRLSLWHQLFFEKIEAGDRPVMRILLFIHSGLPRGEANFFLQNFLSPFLLLLELHLRVKI